MTLHHVVTRLNVSTTWMLPGDTFSCDAPIYVYPKTSSPGHNSFWLRPWRIYFVVASRSTQETDTTYTTTNLYVLLGPNVPVTEIDL